MSPLRGRASKAAFVSSRPTTLMCFCSTIRTQAASRETSSANTWITFGVLGHAIREVLIHLDSDTARQPWRDAVGVDCGDRQVIAGLLLRWAIRANPDGVVLFGTIRADHIQAAVTGVDRKDGDLDAFLRLIDAVRNHRYDGRAEV
jgi:hypothetical protein